jgi:hypothetical protein
MKCSCINCKSEVTTNNINKHYDRCLEKGGKFGWNRLPDRQLFDCVHCGKVCKNKNSVNNHERLCKSNPNRQNHPKGMSGKTSSRKGKTAATDPSIAKAVSTLKNRIKSGEIVPKKIPHTEETKNLLSIKACERLQKNSKYSKNTRYGDSILESSYEVRTAKILDNLNIKWVKVRTGYIWNDNGKIRRYVPDFYLPDYDVFLDPKNDYLIKIDKIKIESAMELNSIRVIVLSNTQITETYIDNLFPR